MENLLVDAETGHVGVISVIKTARPDIKGKDLLTKVKDTLLGYTEHSILEKVVKGRKTSVTPLEACEYIFDYISGRGWNAWRAASGEAFKESLRNHVDQIYSSFQKQLAENKSRVLAKESRTANSPGYVRIHKATGKGAICVRTSRAKMLRICSHASSKRKFGMAENRLNQMYKTRRTQSPTASSM